MSMIYEVCELFVEPNDVECMVEDLRTGEIIFEGLYEDLDFEIQNMEICSIDNLYGKGVMVFNVDITE